MRLFGTSGIRGIVGDLITPEFCGQIGQALGSALAEHSCVGIATDARLSRDMVREAVTAGLVSAGVDVVHLGILPTPALAWLTREMKFQAGLMITASHNPPQYNGIKVFNTDTIGYSITQEDEIEALWRSKDFRVSSSPGSVSGDESAKERYIEKLLDAFAEKRFDPDLKVVVDPGNGAAAGFASDLFNRVGIKCLPLNDEPDGSFPGRASEPTGDTLKGTIEFLRENGADLAVCFDGDADRVVFCDREGFLGFTPMVSYISRLAAKQTGSRTVAATIEVGRLLDLAVADLGIEVVRGKVGDVHLAHLVRENGASIGVEDVGVYIIPEMGWYPESMFAALMLLSEIHSVSEIREFFRQFPPFHVRKAKVGCPNERKEAVMGKIRERASDLKPGKTNTIDGIRLDFDDAWMLIRASGTEPVIRAMVESTEEKAIEKRLSEGIRLIEDAKA